MNMYIRISQKVLSKVLGTYPLPEISSTNQLTKISITALGRLFQQKLDLDFFVMDCLLAIALMQVHCMIDSSSDCSFTKN